MKPRVPCSVSHLTINQKKSNHSKFCIGGVRVAVFILMQLLHSILLLAFLLLKDSSSSPGSLSWFLKLISWILLSRYDIGAQVGHTTPWTYSTIHWYVDISNHLNYIFLISNFPLTNRKSHSQYSQFPERKFILPQYSRHNNIFSILCPVSYCPIM